MTIGSLFAGIGGIDIAFRQAGFDIKWAIEKDAACCRTYRNNFDGTDLLECDIHNVDLKSLPKVDIITAGFPLQESSEVFLILGAVLSLKYKGLLCGVNPDLFFLRMYLILWSMMAERHSMLFTTHYLKLVMLFATKC